MSSSLRWGLPGGVEEARNLVNCRVVQCPPRSDGASLEAWEGRETFCIVWLPDTLLAQQAGPPWMGGKGTKPCK
eukprot:9504176-Pyramimonas_sp.AAC.3